MESRNDCGPRLIGNVWWRLPRQQAKREPADESRPGERRNDAHCYHTRRHNTAKCRMARCRHNLRSPALLMEPWLCTTVKLHIVNRHRPTVPVLIRGQEACSVPSRDDRSTSRLDAHVTDVRCRSGHVSCMSRIARGFGAPLQFSPCSMRLAAVAARNQNITVDVRRDPDRHATTIGASESRHGVGARTIGKHVGGSMPDRRKE
jgi:hypothetical protein